MLHKLIPSSLFSLVFVFFFFSFLVVSCNDSKLAELTGYELLENNTQKLKEKANTLGSKSLFGSTLGSSSVSSSIDDDASLDTEVNTPPSKWNPLLIIALTMALFGAVIAWIDLPKWALLIPSSLGFIALIIFYWIADSKIKEAMGGMDMGGADLFGLGKMISIEFTWTFYLTLFVFISAGLARYLIDWIQNPALVTLTSPKKQCHYCLNYIHKDAAVCMYCKKEFWIEPTKHLEE